MTQSLKPIHLSRAANDLLKLSSIPEEMFAPDDGQPNFTFDTPKQTNMIQKEKISLKKKKKGKRTIEDLKENENIGFIDSSGHKGYVANVYGNLSAICANASMFDCRSNFSYGGNEVLSHRLSDVLAIENRTCCTIKSLYTFPTRKDLYKWLAED